MARNTAEQRGLTAGLTGQEREQLKKYMNSQRSTVHAIIALMVLIVVVVILSFLLLPGSIEAAKNALILSGISVISIIGLCFRRMQLTRKIEYLRSVDKAWLSVIRGKASKLYNKKMKELKRRTKLIMEARKGNQDAIDSLTIEDIDLFAMISRRAAKEDLYSLVETTFIPYGSESDNYSILGNILGMRLVKNLYTNEEVYQLELECNQILFDVCINKRDLVGIPEVGRRFKGTIWMQGRIDFSSYL